MLLTNFAKFFGGVGCVIATNGGDLDHYMDKNKLCAWWHNMPPLPASWKYLHIYSPGGGTVPA